VNRPGAGLRRFVGRPAAAPPEVERCEMCAEPLAAEHGHVVQVEQRALLCTCRACSLLFTSAGAAGGRYRAVPDRYLSDPGFGLTEAQWEQVSIPVGVAFFFRHSGLDRVIALYPSPAGATESLLDPGTWDAVLAATPLAGLLAPDVEALLVRRQQPGRPGGPAGDECHLIPIDACYELVGRVRRHWTGFDGGAQAWAEIGDFFDRVRARSRPAAAVRAG
jgi:hypothetical protein